MSVPTLGDLKARAVAEVEAWLARNPEYDLPGSERCFQQQLEIVDALTSLSDDVLIEMLQTDRTILDLGVDSDIEDVRDGILGGLKAALHQAIDDWFDSRSKSSQTP